MAKKPATDPGRWKSADPKELQRIYETARQSVVKRVTDPRQRQKALARFDSDPRMQALRKAAGFAPVTTRQQEIRTQAKKPEWQRRTEEIEKLAKLAETANRREIAKVETARRTIERQKAENKDSIVPESVRDTGAGMLAGVNDAMFGLPARAAAAITGTDNALMQEYINQQGQRAPVTNFLTTLGASLLTGGALVKGGAALATRLAASGSRPVAATGQALQRGQQAMALQRGQNVRNAGRLALGGGAAGAAQAAGKGEDIGEGTALGAGGTLLLGAGAKGGGWLASKAGEALRLSGADTILRNYTKTTREALQKRLDDFRKRTGSEPTLYELLDLEDRSALQSVFRRLDRGQQERGATMARERVESIPGEVAQTVRQATRGQRRENIKNLTESQVDARRGSQPTVSEMRLAVGAADNPTKLAQLRRNEAQSIMRPFDDQIGADSVDSLIPTEMRALDPDKPGEITEVEIDPEMAAMIRSAAGLARIRDKEQGLTVRELTGMVSKLKEIATGGSDPIQRGNAQRAVDHLEDTLIANVSGIRPALDRMNMNWAARSRQLEGMRETRMQAEVDPSTSQRLRRSENVFETPEGAVGRAMGQRTELLDDLGRANAPALGTVRELAESTTRGRQISQNLGVPATRQITDAARAQSESARRLATAVRDPNFDQADLEAGDLALLAAGLNPSSMAYTKARAMSVAFQRLANSIPEGRSRILVEMLFSRDPAMTQRAINALRSEGRSGMDTLKQIAAVMGGATLGTSGITDPAESLPTPEPEGDEAEDTGAVGVEDINADFSQLSDEELLAMYQSMQEESSAEEDGEDRYLRNLSDEDLMMMYQDLEAEGNLEDPFAEGPWKRHSL